MDKVLQAEVNVCDIIIDITELVEEDSSIRNLPARVESQGTPSATKSKADGSGGM